MKQIILKTSILISGILFFAACKKDSLPSPAQDEIAGQASQKGKPVSHLTRVKTRTIGVNVITYTYDAAGRSLGYTGSGALTYEYPDASHVIETPQSGSVTHYDLNNKGLAVKRTHPYWHALYSYNTKKQVESILIQDNNGFTNNTTYTYVNGNVDKITSTQSADNPPQTFTYYLDKPNVLDNDVFGESFRGVGSKNLVKTRTIDSFGYVESYSYDFDLQGRVIKVKWDVNGNPQADISYSYY